MNFNDFLKGDNSKAIDPKIESEIVWQAKEVGVSVRSILESKDKQVVVVYYNFGDEVVDGGLTDKNEIFRKLNPIATKVLNAHDYKIKQSLRSNYDKNVACIYYYIKNDE